MITQFTRHFFAATAFAALLAGTLAFPAHAAESGDIVLRFGGHVVAPKADNGTLAGQAATIDDSLRPTFSVEYMLTSNWGVEILAAWPFSHEVSLNGTTIAEVKHLPPTIGVNYHFLTDARVSPFIGAGINFTWFYDVDSRGPLAGADISIDNSWGPALHAGIDIKLQGNWLLTADVRWIGIEGDVSVNGTEVGTAEVDPFVYGLSLGYRF